jgi:hypothetical protein
MTTPDGNKRISQYQKPSGGCGIAQEKINLKVKFEATYSSQKPNGVPLMNMKSNTSRLSSGG